MAKAESIGRSNMNNCLNVEFMRSLVKQYSELGQWTSALFWADAAAAVSDSEVASGDDIWLLASSMLARGELHRAAETVTSRELHRQHLLCLGVVMRAYLSAKEPATVLSMLEECDPMLLEPRSADQTHNRALASVLVSQARALSALERREAAAEALCSALRADCACYEALDLLLDQHSLTPRQERELIESLPIHTQLSPAEGALVKGAYRARLQRYSPAPPAPPSTPAHDDDPAAGTIPSPVSIKLGRRSISMAGTYTDETVEVVRMRTLEANACETRALCAGGAWGAALRALDRGGRWAGAELRAAALLHLGNTTQLFAFAHDLVDAYPHSWTAWFAVGCYYYLIGKRDFARRYFSKAKSLEPGAGCVWLAYGHSFAADSEPDQALAAYFKASQLMPGCYLPLLYVGVECSLLNNVSMCERFLLRAALLHNDNESGGEVEGPGEGWERISRMAASAHLAHEAGAAAYAAGSHQHARALFLRALDVAGATPDDPQVSASWAPTLDALGHACRRLGLVSEALAWHERAQAARPRGAGGAGLAARGLCLALLGRAPAAAAALHAALARDPDDVVASALLDAVVDHLDAALSEEEIPQFPFPQVQISVPGTPRGGAGAGVGGGEGTGDVTIMSDMSMSFD